MKRKIKDLRKGDEIKIHGRLATVASGVSCFKANNGKWSFDVRLKDSPTCSTVSFADGDEEVELKQESPLEPIPEEARVMEKYLEKPKRRRKKKAG